ncbi:hypothetical protein ACFC4S_24060 [Priestia megaterium]|uniref:hypothetical protein n=1 Tax=Priestia megaterium TaxID=1404 RepID=UPI001DB825D3|nr:hypothetical protein [Priestia megaterium]
MINQIMKLITKGHQEVPLFHIAFSFKKYQQTKGRESCDLKLHPLLLNDKLVAKRLNELIDYTRKEYAEKVFNIVLDSGKSPRTFPLLYATFNLKKYKESGEKGSCNLSVPPPLSGDKLIINTANEVVDYIRKNYDMKKLV